MTYHDNNNINHRRSHTPEKGRNTIPWVIGALAVMLVLGFGLWALNDNVLTASKTHTNNSAAPTTNSLQQGNTTGSAPSIAPAK